MDGAEQSLAATRSAEAASNATLAITEASNTAWRARQTAQAESAAEQQAMGASEVAGQSRSVRAYNAELAAAQSYNLVRFGVCGKCLAGLSPIALIYCVRITSLLLLQAKQRAISTACVLAPVRQFCQPFAIQICL